MQNRLQEFLQGLDLQYAQGDLGEVEKFLITSAIRAQKSGQSGAEEQIAVYNELGSFYRGAGRYALSLDAFERPGRWPPARWERIAASMPQF